MDPANFSFIRAYPHKIKTSDMFDNPFRVALLKPSKSSKSSKWIEGRRGSGTGRRQRNSRWPIMSSGKAKPPPFSYDNTSPCLDRYSPNVNQSTFPIPYCRYPTAYIFSICLRSLFSLRLLKHSAWSVRFVPGVTSSRQATSTMVVPFDYKREFVLWIFSETSWSIGLTVELQQQLKWPMCKFS